MNKTLIPDKSRELNTEITQETFDLLPEDLIQKIVETRERVEKAVTEARRSLEVVIKERGDAATPDESN